MGEGRGKERKEEEKEGRRREGEEEEEKGNFTIEKPGRYHLNQVIKVNIISNGTNRNYSPPNRTQ